MFTLANISRVALVHDWLVGQRGGEQVLLELCMMFPKAHIFTLIHRPGAVDRRIETHPIHVSFVQKLSTPHGRFRHLLPLFFRAIESLDVSAYDLVISTSHCVAHGVRVRPKALHIAYVHSPMRYLYDQLPHYLPQWLPEAVAPKAAVAARAATTWLRHKDRAAAQRPQAIVANSKYVATRIERVWHRQAQVVHPPVDIDDFGATSGSYGPSPRRGLLWVGALVPYKRVELCVATSNLMGVPLTIVGRGPMEARLRQLAGPQVTFAGDVPHGALKALYQSHEALMYPGEEDFGIVPVEAMAAGCPVLGLGRGGLTETVRTTGPNTSGVLVQQDTAAAFVAGLSQLRTLVAHGTITQGGMGQHVQAFSQQAFVSNMTAVLEGHLAQGRRV